MFRPMYRKIQTSFFCSDFYSNDIAGPGSRQSLICLMKIPVLLLLAWRRRSSRRRAKCFRSAPLARAQTERRRWLALVTGFGKVSGFDFDFVLTGLLLFEMCVNKQISKKPVQQNGSPRSTTRINLIGGGKSRVTRRSIPHKTKSGPLIET